MLDVIQIESSAHSHSLGVFIWLSRLVACQMYILFTFKLTQKRHYRIYYLFTYSENVQKRPQSLKNATASKHNDKDLCERMNRVRGIICKQIVTHRMKTFNLYLTCVETNSLPPRQTYSFNRAPLHTKQSRPKCLASFVKNVRLAKS